LNGRVLRVKIKGQREEFMEKLMESVAEA